MRMLATVAFLGFAAVTSADEACPMHAQHMRSAEAVKARGEEGMGFSQDATQHHFRLSRDGGTIEVAAIDESDAATRDRIREHLAAIATAFSAGDFDVPMFIHAQVPPGARAMKRLKAKISYVYEDTPSGGSVRVSTEDPKAIAAVHAFLRFQIADHHTGDSPKIQ